jgi:hypothetical protein
MSGQLHAPAALLLNMSHYYSVLIFCVFRIVGYDTGKINGFAFSIISVAGLVAEPEHKI